MIDNITDQIELFTHDVIIAIRMAEDNGFTKDQAIKIVGTAVESMKAEVMHHYSTNGIKHDLNIVSPLDINEL